MAARNLIAPGFGTSIEVLVTWQDRIIGSHHFKGEKTISLGSDPSADVVVPIARKKISFLKTGHVASFLPTCGVSGDWLKADSSTSTDTLKFPLALQQGEMIRLNLPEERVAIYIRYSPSGPTLHAGPIADLNVVDGTGLIVVAMLSLIFSLYMKVNAPTALSEPARSEEPRRRAFMQFRKPEKKTEIAQAEPIRIRSEPRVVIKPTTPPLRGLIGAFQNSKFQEALRRTQDPSQILNSAISSKGVGGGPEVSQSPRLKPVGGTGGSEAGVRIGGVGTRGRDNGYQTGNTPLGQRDAALKIDVTGAESEVSGTIDREAIRRMIQSNRNSIRNCYEQALQRHPDLYGKIVLEWDITEDGMVRRAAVHLSSLGDAKVGQCLVSRIRAIQFPRLPAGMEGRVRFPFVFSNR